MALDNNAGNKRTVSLMRNLTPNVPQAVPTAPVAEAVAATTAPISVAPVLDTPSYARKPEGSNAAAAVVARPAAAQSNRTKKVSFLAEPKLEERFRKARLRAGFDKLEDAYNEALIVFCEQVESGKIDRF